MYSNTQPTNIKYTKHALERMELRAITEEMVLKTISRPDRTYPEEDGGTKFIRQVDGVRLHVVCKPLPDEAKWLVKSTWVRGEDDNGNRVDRDGHYLGKRRRAVVRAPGEPRFAFPWVNVLLASVLIALVILLIYFLIR
ncbi:MAG: DUF4258 domain-containing protein [Chloroflexota bacterium]